MREKEKHQIKTSVYSEKRSVQGKENWVEEKEADVRSGKAKM